MLLPQLIMLRKLRQGANADASTGPSMPAATLLAGLQNFALIVLGILSAGMGIKGFLQSSQPNWRGHVRAQDPVNWAGR